MVENGFLTDRDRSFLLGEKEYTGENAKQMRYQARRAIRERTRAAFQDFALLNETLDPEERSKILDVRIPNKHTVSDTGVDEETRDGLVNTIGFIYLALEGELDDPAPRVLPTVPSFEEILKAAVRGAESARHSRVERTVIPSVEFDVKITEKWDTGHAAAKLARGNVEALSEPELRALVQPAADYINKHGQRDGLWSLVDAKREEMETAMDPREEVPEWFEDETVEDGDLPDRDEQLSDRDRVEMIIRLDRVGYSVDEILEIVEGPDASDEE